jgi:tRNA pseudouridine55 synthase
VTTTKELSGFINIDKPEGWTSHDVVAKLRKLIGIKKIGHAGTLDPFATGVLPMAIGSATRLIRFLKKSKKYSAEIDLSFTTDTDDLTGECLDKNPEVIDQATFSERLKKFLGTIDQVPPLYSAKKVNGKKLYELMREGQDLKLEEVKSKQVTINEIKLLDFNFPKASVEISCGEGTYIRSIARDLGGHLTKLRRLESNGFAIESSIRFEDLAEGLQADDLIQKSIEFIDLPLLSFEQQDVVALQQGRTIYLDKENEDLRKYISSNPAEESYLQCLDSSKELIGLANILLVKGSELQIQPKIIL